MLPEDALAIAHALHLQLRFTAGEGVWPTPMAYDLVDLCTDTKDPDLAVACKIFGYRPKPRSWEEAMWYGEEGGFLGSPPSKESAVMAAALNRLYRIR
jgi:hypothetical protein